MNAFVDTSRAAITADGEIDPKTVTPDIDVVFVRKRMDFGTQQKVISAALKIAGLKDEDAASVDVGAYQLALAQCNILDWSGPAFGGQPCTPKNISRLDPDFPVLQAALMYIGNRNTNGESSDPKSSPPAAS